jgi:NDP-sugar pyrophosphorylase family protein
VKAIVFAAGRGTRLGSLTAERPKALIEVGGVTLLETVLSRLRDAGAREVVINLHHFAEQIETFVHTHAGFGLKISYSRETELLDTGGGLKQAAPFFSDGQPFWAHNVDVLSDIDLGAMLRAHFERGALATLAVKTRPTARPLLIDDDNRLCGRIASDRERVVRRPFAGTLQPVGFCGVHVLSPEIFPRLSETGAFSIITSYLRLAAEDATIFAHRVDHARWRDCGRPEDLRPL